MAYGEDRMVVARYRDGRMIKGTTQDFAAHKPDFHVYEGGDEGSQATKIAIADLKALFFVKSYEGDPDHQPSQDLTAVRGQGRKIRVTFADGEELAGFCMGYSPDRAGFFVVPADATGNNTRVFVVNAAVGGVAWA